MNINVYLEKEYRSITLMVKSFEFEEGAFVLFIDFKLAFDIIKRGKLRVYIAFRELKVSNKLLNTYKRTLEDTEWCVGIGNKVTDNFKVKEQGD